jgi:hypothetical protein
MAMIAQGGVAISEMSNTVAAKPVTGLERKMVLINIIAIVSMAIHDADHVRQAIGMNYTISIHVAAVLLSAYIPLFASIWWASHRRPLWATTATALVTGGVLLLLSFVHLIGVEQIWEPLGDVFGMWGVSYWDMGVDAVSWIAFVLLAVSYSWLLVATVRTRRAVMAAAAIGMTRV